jgi:hypothetical protein
MRQIQLEEISFNHLGDRSSGSVTIQNEGQVITAPEWRRGTIKPEHSLVAYAINQQRNGLTILARLSSPDRSLTEIEVQAVADPNNVLGHIQGRTVTFNAGGQSEILRFSLPAPRFREFGVNVGTASWRWEYRVRSTDDWTRFDETTHRVYVLVDTPVEPWDDELPRAEVLDLACVWANGAKNVDEAASSITRAVYALGDPLAVPPLRLLRYQRTSTYAQGTFNISGFLRLLSGADDVPARVNCDDCATIVSTFGNILGSNLSQSEMGDVFGTHHIRLIGKSKWTRPTFPRHAVAWKEPCLETDPVFDACLQVDGDNDPADHTHFIAEVPVNTPFAGHMNYKFSLFRGGNCQARPERKKRRPLGVGFLGQVRFTDPILLAFLKFLYDFENWPPGDPPKDANHRKGLLRSFPNVPNFESWESGAVERFQDEDVEGIRFFLKRADVHTHNLVEVNLYEVKASTAINDFVLQLLAQFHQSDVQRETVNTLGRLTFVEPCDSAVVFVRNDVIAFVRSVGRERVSVFDIATIIDLALR